MLLIAGGLVAGFINTLAGGGSFLTVPLLVMVGLPPTVANATNRLAVFVQSVSAVAGFRQEGVREMGTAVRVLPAALLGSWIGAYVASHVPDREFGRAFGLIMLAALPIILWNPKPRESGPTSGAGLPFWLRQLLYFGIGLYGGAIQAGIGIPLLLALAAAGGLDLVRANSVKVVLVAALTAIALVQFAWADKVRWVYGAVLAVGSGLGGYAGSRFGARVGERLIRPVLTLAVIGLAFRLLLAPGN
ncbi:MAG: sulfite exporter TauE/SafE family protein [bacterium]|nr:sulfite exporter TauE/SafE family protein [bacterium]